ncbi:MAG: glycosyltransferase [Candidatus Omnitrophica bacterium]|jgi:glycosyltransferase involved in cell wall biosynthesis|nr:glycosyltransferase [Candidatus Omnitrophota bacterium]
MKEKLISIVIPSFNSFKTLKQSIKACLSQDYPSEAIEIIVVDDGSTDKTGEFLDKTGIKYIYQDNAGPAAARNTGWKSAKGEIVFFTDSDCLPSLAWVKNLVKYYEDAQVACAGGSYDIANPQNLLASLIHEEIMLRHAKMPLRVKALGSYNFSARKIILEETGGFNQQYPMASGEDNDLSYKIIKKGYALIFDKNVKVCHYHPENPIKYLRTQFWHGFWRVKLYLEHPQMSMGDDYSGLLDYAQPVLALALIITFPFLFFHDLRNIWFALFAAQIFLHLQVGVIMAIRCRNLKYLLFIILSLFRSFARGLGLASALLSRIVVDYRINKR